MPTAGAPDAVPAWTGATPPPMTDLTPLNLFTLESVTEGHPDKLCDAVADAMLDEILANDPTARAAVEVATTTGLVLVLGEVSTCIMSTSRTWSGGRCARSATPIAASGSTGRPAAR